MKESLYFFLEPYVYLKADNRGLLLVNLLDDKAFTFEDSKSINIGQALLSSHKKTIRITSNDMQIPIIANAIDNFMGDIVSAKSHPLQFDSEINNLSGIEAYRKSVLYSKYNIGRFISNCTVFADMTDQDCHDYIEYTTGIQSTDNAFLGASSKMNEKDIDCYINGLVSINPNITLNVCGMDFRLFDYISNKFPTAIINPVVSFRTLELYPDKFNYLTERGLRYITIGFIA